MAAAAKPLTSFAGSVLSTSLKVGGLVSALTRSCRRWLAHGPDGSVDGSHRRHSKARQTGWVQRREAITGLTFAAKLAAVDQETLTTSFLTKMQKALNGAAEDGSDTSSAFASLGLNAKQLANLPTDQAFTQIAEKLSHVENASQRAGLEMQIFGRGGAALDPLLTAWCCRHRRGNRRRPRSWA